MSLALSLAGADTEEALQLGAEMHRNRTTNPFRIQPAACRWYID